ncbi:Nuclear pore complex protein NUP1 [Quillaja saponaria]|uniref:Nuclear pore complex protein NUP1 n=1 Tax=Quillaja saponaria TaxID=32244 RepID=A0AAD7PWP3_QUISA|nr:Nuclear pore complex protein NUP1 [Quillaja saponaria]
MATAREENRYEEGGLGTGGKFRKRPFRRTQTTPYDRPPTALRNSTSNNGWLSKLVDPAQRLITSSAHRLFSSVFRKRLPAPPPPRPYSPDDETLDIPQEAIALDNAGKQEGAIDQSEKQTNTSDRGSLAELEKLLNQKTFTRFEIDRLTALLHSRTVDSPAGEEHKRHEVIPSKLVLSHNQKEELPKLSTLENGIESHIVSTPYVSPSVLGGDVATPAELAKAYMGSRPSKVSPSVLRLRSQAFREEPTLVNSQSFVNISPIMSNAPRSSSHGGAIENGFITPRSRGRSAIYSMARTPYSKVYSTSTLKGVGSTVDAYGGPSSSAQSAWDHNRHSGSKQGAVKRRSSVVESDLGSVGPIRRIRQKSNLLSSKGLSIPASGSPLSASGSRVGIGTTQHASSSMQKPLLLGEAKHFHMKMSTENVDDTMPATSFPPLPSKSSEMGSKILQQLDKLVLPKEKSEIRLPTVVDKAPTKLSPSMLHGQALRSLENVDSSKFLEDIRDYNELENLVNNTSGAQCLTPQNQDKVGNGSLRIISSSERLAPDVTDVDSTFSNKNTVSITMTVDSSVIKPVSDPPKKQAFHMSAHEDYLELDDDVYPNGSAASPSLEGKEKMYNTTVAEKASHTEATAQGKPPASSPSLVVQPAASAAVQSTLAFEKTTTPNELSSSFPTPTAGNKVQTLAAVPVSAGDKVTSLMGPIFSFDSNKDFDKLSQKTLISVSSVGGDSAGLKVDASSDPKLLSSNSSAIVAGTTDLMPKVPEARSVDNKNDSNAGFFFSSQTALPSAVSTPVPTSTTTTFSFINNKNIPNQNNGSLASSPSPFSSTFPSPVPNNITLQNPLISSSLIASSSSTAITSSRSTAAMTASSNGSPSTSAAAVSNFGSLQVPSTSSLPVSSTSVTDPVETKIRQGPGFSNLSNTIFGGASATNRSTGSSIFGFSSSATSTANNPSQGSAFGGQAPLASTGVATFGFSSSPTSTANNPSQGSAFGGQASLATTGVATSGFCFSPTSTANNLSQGSSFGGQASLATTGVATFTQSLPNQFSSATSFPSFGLTANTAFSSGSSSFASSTPATNIFNSDKSFGISTSASSSEANHVSSSSGAASSLFGTSPFGSTFSSSSPPAAFSFGAAASSTSAPLVFGSSIGASPFSFTSAAATTPQPVFGSPNPVSPFGSAPLVNNNDQMNMEDSMAEDAIQASTPSGPAFGQSPVLPAAANFRFGPNTPSGGSPFQFASQQNLSDAQNPSLFQPSGSLEFNAGGSFSLGSGGGDKSNRRFIRVKSKQRKK